MLSECKIIDRRITGEIPTQQGIYVLFDMSNVCVYLGSTKNLKQRILSHVHRKKIEFHSAMWFPADDSITNEMLVMAEYECLKSLLIDGSFPKYNKLIAF